MSELDFSKLKEPFPSKDIEWRVQASGDNNGKIWARVLAYVTNRAIMDRLDETVGADNWRNQYEKAPDGGVMCGLSIRLGTEWVTKWDGAENTDIEGVKGGLSNSMKRAAVQWGIGRYLYNLDAYYADISDSGINRAITKDKKPFRWNPPQLPEWALPVGEQPTGTKTTVPPQKPDASIFETPEYVELKQSIIDWLNVTPKLLTDSQRVWVEAQMAAKDIAKMKLAIDKFKAASAEARK